MARRPERKYYFRGPIEQGRDWADGYSQGEPPIVEYPWLSRRDCRSLAKDGGFKAVFYRDGKIESFFRRRTDR